MNYLHYDFHLQSDDVVEVNLDRQANVRLLDDANFAKYQRGEPHTFHGGLAQVKPVHLRPPHSGHWHVVIDLGGFAGTVRANVSVISAVGQS